MSRDRIPFWPLGGFEKNPFLYVANGQTNTFEWWKVISEVGFPSWFLGVLSIEKMFRIDFR